jgi:hypothetical protein
MARTGRPAKPIELHKRQGTYRPDRHGPKPMLAWPPLVRPSLVYTSRLTITSTCARTVLRRWTWSCSRIGRGVTCTPTACE